MTETLRFVVEGPLRTKGAGVFQDYMEEGKGVRVEEVRQTQERMREAFSKEREYGQCLREWLLESRPLAVDAEFRLFGSRAKQTDVDNLLTELFDQMLLALFPEGSNFKRSRKDHSFYDVHVRKTEVLDRADEQSIIIIRPLAPVSGREGTHEGCYLRPVFIREPERGQS